MLNRQSRIKRKHRLQLVLNVLVEILDIIPVLTAVNDQTDIGDRLAQWQLLHKGPGQKVFEGTSFRFSEIPLGCLREAHQRRNDEFACRFLLAEVKTEVP